METTILIVQKEELIREEGVNHSAELFESWHYLLFLKLPVYRVRMSLTNL
jgi:hypothetical protein